MSVEGSITPPLSDDESLNSQVNCTSPILNPLKTGLNNSLKQKKLRFIETKKCFNWDDCFYKAKLELMFIEKLVNQNTSNTFSRNECYVHQFLSEVEALTSNYENLQDVDTQLKMLELLFALSTDVSHVIQYGFDHLKTATNVDDFLHQCDNVYLIKWFHLFCNINVCLMKSIAVLFTANVNLQTLEIYYSDGMPVISDGDILIKTMDRILHDIAYLSFNHFKSMYTPERGFCLEIISTDPYLCSCISNMVKKCHSLFKAEDDFWYLILSIVNNTIKNSNSKKSTIDCTSLFGFDDANTAISFSWWWIRKLPYNSNILCCHNIINRMLRFSFSNVIEWDHQLACQLLCYKKVFSSFYGSLNGRDWKATELAGFGLLWQNLSQHLSVNTSDKFVKDKVLCHFLELSLQEWIEKIDQLETIFHDDTVINDSFTIFLSLFHYLLSKNQGRIWLLLKERFFLRFQLSTLKQINELGLKRFFFIIIIVLLFCPCNNTTQTLEKFLSLLDYCIEGCDLSKEKVFVSAVQCFSWYIKTSVFEIGLYAIIYVCKKRQIDYFQASEKAEKYFGKILKFFLDKTLLGEQKSNVFNVIVHYLNCFTQLLRVSAIFESNQKLLLQPNHLQTLFNHISVYNNEVMMDFVSEVVACLRMLHNQSSNCITLHQFFVCIIEKLTPWLQNFVSSQENNLNFYDVAGDITIFLASCKLETNNCLLFETWSFFACNGHFDPIQRSKYLQKCLSSTDVVARLVDENQFCNDDKNVLAQKTTSFLDCTVQGWIKSFTLLSSQSCSELDAITHEIGKLPIIKNLISEYNKFTFVLFLKKLSSEHKSAKNFFERIYWTSKATLWFNPSIESAMLALHNGRCVESIYFSFSLIFEHCSVLLHTGKPSFVVRVMNTFIVEPPLLKHSQLILDNIYKCLDKFVLGSIVIGRSSVPVDQALKKVIDIYLNKWPLDAKTLDHPFIRLLSLASTREVISPALLLLRDVLEREPRTDKLAMVVEILHTWSSKSPPTNNQDLPSFVGVLRRVQPQLRFNQSLVQKMDHLIKVLK